MCFLKSRVNRKSNANSRTKGMSPMQASMPFSCLDNTPHTIVIELLTIRTRRSGRGAHPRGGSAHGSESHASDNARCIRNYARGSGTHTRCHLTHTRHNLAYARGDHSRRSLSRSWCWRVCSSTRRPDVCYTIRQQLHGVGSVVINRQVTHQHMTSFGVQERCRSVVPTEYQHLYSINHKAILTSKLPKWPGRCSAHRSN